MPATMLDKIWAAHSIIAREDGPTLLHIDRHLIHDGSSNAFRMLKERGLAVARPDRTFATPDHYVPTIGRDLASINEPHRRGMVEDLDANAAAAGVTLFGLGDRRQGIVHVVGPEQGLSQPGMVMVCGDSHTATHGALGALAFGVGASEVAHVLATQTLWQKKPKSLRITVDGSLAPGVHAKDVILAIIAEIGAAGGTGHVIEYAGSTIRALSIEGRLTICNMSIEAGARAGMVAPDDTTFAYLEGRPYAPKGKDWDKALTHWRSLPSDADASLRSRGPSRGGRDRSDGDLGDEPGSRGADHRARPRPGRRHGRDAARQHGTRALLHGSEAGNPALRHRHRSRLPGLLHEQPHRRPSRCRRDRGWPPRRGPGDGGAGLGSGEGASRGGRARRNLQASRLRMARGRVLDVRGHER